LQLNIPEKSEATIEFEQTTPKIQPCLVEITLLNSKSFVDPVAVIQEYPDDDMKELLEFLIELPRPPTIDDPNETLAD